MALAAVAIAWFTIEPDSVARRAGADVDRMGPAASDFRPTIENAAPMPAAAPDGMVWIPGGEFSMGAAEPVDPQDAVGMQATRDSRPVHRVSVDGFWMDRTEVTNDQFAAFVEATGYVTVAERYAAARGLSRGAARPARCRLSRLLASRSCGAAR